MSSPSIQMHQCWGFLPPEILFKIIEQHFPYFFNGASKLRGISGEILGVRLRLRDYQFLQLDKSLRWAPFHPPPLSFNVNRMTRKNFENTIFKAAQFGEETHKSGERTAGANSKEEVENHHRILEARDQRYREGNCPYNPPYPLGEKAPSPKILTLLEKPENDFVISSGRYRFCERWFMVEDLGITNLQHIRFDWDTHGSAALVYILGNLSLFPSLKSVVIEKMEFLEQQHGLFGMYTPLDSKIGRTLDERLAMVTFAIKVQMILGVLIEKQIPSPSVMLECFSSEPVNNFALKMLKEEKKVSRARIRKFKRQMVWERRVGRVGRILKQGL